MQLVNNDITFTLEIAGYQYPQIDKDYYDSNWLMISCRVHDHDKEWSFLQPALLTTEIQELIVWFTELASGNYSTENIFINEPIMCFRLIEKKIVRVCLWAEGLPKWYNGEESYNLDFDIKSLDLWSIVNDLKNQLNKFPIR